MYGLSQLAAPVEEPVSVCEARDWCRLTTTQDDQTLSALLLTARRMVELYVGRQLCTARWLLTLDTFPYPGGWELLASAQLHPDAHTILIPKAPLQSVQSVNYFDMGDTLRTLDPSVYNVDTTQDPGRIVLAMNKVWPVIRLKPAAVRIEFTAGYGSPEQVPTELKTAILMCVAQWYENRGDQAGADLPPAVRRLLAINWSGCLEYGL